MSGGSFPGTRFPPDRSLFPAVSPTKYQHVVSPAPPNLLNPGMGQYPFTSSSSVLPLTLFTASIPTVTAAGLYDTAHFAFSTSSTPASFHLGPPIKSINTIHTTNTDTSASNNESPNHHRHHLSHVAQFAHRATATTTPSVTSGGGVEPRGVIFTSPAINSQTSSTPTLTTATAAASIPEGSTSSLFQIGSIETGTSTSNTSLSTTSSHLNLPSSVSSSVSFTRPRSSSSFSSSVTVPPSVLGLGDPSTSTPSSGPTSSETTEPPPLASTPTTSGTLASRSGPPSSETDPPPHTSAPTTSKSSALRSGPTSSETTNPPPPASTPTTLSSRSGPPSTETDPPPHTSAPTTSKSSALSSGPTLSETDPPPHTSTPTISTTADGTTDLPESPTSSTLAPPMSKPSSTSSAPTMSNPPGPKSSLEASSTTSISDFSSKSITPSASFSSSRDSIPMTVMTNTSFFSSSSSTFTSNTSSSSSSTTSISSSSHTSVSPLPSSSTSSSTSKMVIPPSSSPSRVPASAFPPTWRTQGVWSTITTTKVYTTSLRGGGSTVITTVMQSGVLSTNNPLVGSRFSRNTKAIVGVAVSATVGVVLSVLIVFLWCKPFRDRKERENRRRSRRSGLRFSGPGSAGPVRAGSGSGSGHSGGGGLSRDSSALILGAGHASRSRSGEDLDDRGERDEEEGEEEEDDDEEEVWRSPLIGEDDDIGAGMGSMGTAGGMATLPSPSESGGGGRKSSTSHSVQSRTNSHSHSNSRSHSHSSKHGYGRSVDNAGPSSVVLATDPGTSIGAEGPPSMAEFGMGPPVSYAAYTYPLGPVGSSGYAGGGIGEDQGTQGIQSARERGSFASLGGFVSPPSSYMPHASYASLYAHRGPRIVDAVPPISGEVGHVRGETGDISRETVVVAESTPAPVTLEQGQRGENEDMSSATRVASGRRPKRRLTASTSGGHKPGSASTSSADAPGSTPTPPEPARTRSGSAPESMSSLQNTRGGGKGLRGIMNRIRTSVPSIQVTDVVLPSRRSSRDTPSGTQSASVTAGSRPGYDYGVVGRPSQRFVREVQIQPPAAVALGHRYPTVSPEATGVAHNSCHQAQTQGYAPSVYGSAVGTAFLTAERDSEAEEGDSIRVRGSVVTHGLLDPNLSLEHAFASTQGGGGDGVGRSSPNVEGASLRDCVDYSRRIGGMVKNSMARSTTTLETFDQDGRSASHSVGGGVPSMPGTPRL